MKCPSWLSSCCLRFEGLEDGEDEAGGGCGPELNFLFVHSPRASLVAQLVKNPLAMQQTLVQFLGQGRSPGEGIGYPLQYSRASLVAQLVKNPPAMWETWVQSLGWGDPWRRESLPIPVFWPRKFHGLYGSWGCKELDTTEWLSLSQATIALFCLLNIILHPQSIFPAVLSVVPAFWVLYKWFRLILQILAQKSPSQRGFP